MRFTVVVATADRPDRLRLCLAALRTAIEARGCDDRIVVVDNAARDSAASVAEEFLGPGDAYITSVPRNKAAALNAGIRAADSEWIAFTDDDCLPDAGWLTKAAEFIEHNRYRVVGGQVVLGLPERPVPQVLMPDGEGRVPGGGVFVYYCPSEDSGPLPQGAPAPFGANTFVETSVYSELGGYDEELWALCGASAVGSEDGEFGIRVLAKGISIGYCAESKVVHPVHEEKYPFPARWKHAWRIGWRSPIVFCDGSRQPVGFYRLKRAAARGVRALCAVSMLDRRSLQSHSVALAKDLGSFFGRLSSAYRKREAMKQ